MDPLFLTFDTLLEERYLIQGIVGEGGFAVVYEALDQKLGQQVAIKALTYGGLSQEAVARFEQEARMVASLHHADIVRVQDYGITPQGAPFFVMEMLQGYTLDQELWQHGAMEPGRALGLLKRCLHALDTAHANGIVHRDLKPANLFLVHPGTSAESLTILDLGLGYLIEQEAGRLTGDLTLLGTAGYLAPEYLSQRIVTPAMDVYQMGLVMLSMLTGGSPGEEERGAWIARGLACIPTRSVREVIERALDENHATRYAHAGEMLRALEAAEAMWSDAVTTPSTSSSSADPSSELAAPASSRMMIMGAVFALLGLCVMVAFIILDDERDHHAQPSSHITERDAGIRDVMAPGPVTRPDTTPDVLDMARPVRPDMSASEPAPLPEPSVPVSRPATPRDVPQSRPVKPDGIDPALSRELEWLERNR